MGVQALPLLADVGKHEEVNRVVQLGLERFGKVDVLVNVVGMRPHNLPWEYSYEEWQQVFAVNLHSTFYLAKALVPGNDGTQGRKHHRFGRNGVHDRDGPDHGSDGGIQARLVRAYQVAGAGARAARHTGQPHQPGDHR